MNKTVVLQTLKAGERIDDRVSECGEVRIHVPNDVPVGEVQLRVDLLGKVEKCNGQANECVMQGVVVAVVDTNNVLISHGGLLLSLQQHEIIDVCVGAEVRTTVTWGG